MMKKRVFLLVSAFLAVAKNTGRSSGSQLWHVIL